MRERKRASNAGRIFQWTTLTRQRRFRASAAAAMVPRAAALEEEVLPLQLLLPLQVQLLAQRLCVWQVCASRGPGDI